MFKPKTFLDLCYAMKLGTEVEIDSKVGTISSLQREDGSGTNWNITMDVRIQQSVNGTSEKPTIRYQTFFFRE